MIFHYFNVCDINGADVAPVDVITFGSPCQDLSIAGQRAGLDGERSGLFMEAVRIIKEMRTKDERNGNTNEFVRPRYAVWENVHGAFSSQKGEDFRVVLEELAKIKDPTVSIPKPPNGKWLNAGQIVGNGWSIAWRVLDAQFWGVPQRRRRIFLVADFAGGSAGEILFESEGVSRDFTPCGSPWKGTAGNTEAGPGTSSGGTICLNDQGGGVMSVTEDMTATLRAEEHGHQPCVMQSSGFCAEHSAKSRSIGFEEEKSPTLWAGVVPAAVGFDSYNQVIYSECPQTLKAEQGGDSVAKVIAVRTDMTVRRLTPTECARLQGFPDNWGHLTHITDMTDEDVEFWNKCRSVYAQMQGKIYKPQTKAQLIKWYNKLHTDSAEYKMWGNGVALPCVKFVMQGIAKQGAKTMASLFDGSGGFPLASILAGITPLWVSEIEPYCVAITKERFREVKHDTTSAIQRQL